MQNKNDTNIDIINLHKKVDRLNEELDKANQDKYKAFEVCEKLSNNIEILLDEIKSLKLIRQDEVSERLNG